jgi:hypothetical protein
MPSTSVTIGAIFVIALLGLGVYQAYTDSLPQSTLAGAVVQPATQQELNLCMNDCMRNCVTNPGTEAACLEVCDEACGA